MDDPSHVYKWYYWFKYLQCLSPRGATKFLSTTPWGANSHLLTPPGGANKFLSLGCANKAFLLTIKMSYCISISIPKNIFHMISNCIWWNEWSGVCLHLNFISCQIAHSILFPSELDIKFTNLFLKFISAKSGVEFGSID